MHELTLDQVRADRSYTFAALAHAGLAVGGLVLALLLRRPTILMLAAPSMLIIISALLDGRPKLPEIAAAVQSPRVIEGDVVPVTIALRSTSVVPIADVELLPERSLDHVGSLRALGPVQPGHPMVSTFQVVINEWGVVSLGNVRVRVRDRFGLAAGTIEYRIRTQLRVHIHEEPARSLMEPDQFRRLVGSHLSAERGEGCEIADVRPYQPGDRLQALNWRISARNDEPWITLRHPDRSTTVVLLLDAYQSFGHQRADALRRTIRATLGLARLHLDAQDPVGLLIVGQGVRWFPPELGKLHLHALTDALLDLSSSGWAERMQTRSLVDRLIPKDAVVLAISPLADKRFINVLTSLRSRGQSVQVIEPTTYWPRYAASANEEYANTRQAWRVYSLQRHIERRALTLTGIPVVPWEEDQPIESVLMSLRMRQRARRSGASR